MNETTPETTKLQTWFDSQDSLTMTALAAKLGVSLSYVSRLLAGERSVTGDVKWRFAQAYGHEMAENLFSSNGHQEPTQ